ncbi:MAG: DUF4392 domain-containing protein [Gemmataceae bacterium]
MDAAEKLAAILAAVQVDPGNRGLANLFHHFPHDFANACKSLTDTPDAACLIHTGFFIPSADPPAFETDGPLGVAFLARACHSLGIGTRILAEDAIHDAIGDFTNASSEAVTHFVAIERAGPAADGKHYTMRGRDTSPFLYRNFSPDGIASIGIGDGGNEIGMGKLPHALVAENIPNGDLIHCRVPTDHLIVAGVSNWGAYALAAGIFVLRGVKPPSDLFDPDHERAILEAMVKAGPLVDGVTGKPTATVDGLTWDEYAKPLIRIREILETP